jgi:hypothetical protein
MGVRGFLNNLNEDGEDDLYSSEGGEDSNDHSATLAQSSSATAREGLAGQRNVDVVSGTTNAGRRTRGRGSKEFELDLQGATLLGRRHKRGLIGAKSPLSAQPIQVEASNTTHPDLTSGNSPMHT